MSVEVLENLSYPTNVDDHFLMPLSHHQGCWGPQEDRRNWLLSSFNLMRETVILQANIDGVGWELGVPGGVKESPAYVSLLQGPSCSPLQGQELKPSPG